MQIWYVSLFEPLPIDGENVRKMRSGWICDALMRENNVELWIPGFDHLNHNHYKKESVDEKLKSGLNIQYLKGIGYKKDTSFKRLFHNKYIAKEFKKIANQRTLMPDLIITQIPCLELAEEVIKFAEKYKIPIEEYIDRCENNIKLWKDLEKDMSPIYDQPLSRSNEYASYIVDGIVNGNEITINANVMNEGYIDNLPSNCCVEVPCIINSNGFMPQKIGKLPEQLTALMRTNINVQILTAEAALTKKREHIYHAAMLDPLTGANLTIDEIYDMTDKMIEAHGNYLPQYN